MSETITAGAESTPAIPPDLWFPLIRAAWTYVHMFASDILRAHRRHQELIANATTTAADQDARLRDWLADPAHRIPLHAAKPDTDDQVNWSLLTLMLGWHRGLQATAFADDVHVVRADHAVATPANSRMSVRKYCARTTLASETPTAAQTASA